MSEIDLLFLMQGALLVEALVEYLKLVYDRESKKLNIDMAASLVLSVLASWAIHLNLFTALGYKLDADWVGFVLTGVLLSRGTNILHDLLKKLGVWAGTRQP